MLRRETKTKITCPTTSDERRKERNVRIWSGYMSDNNATRPESTANRILNVMWRKRERRERERVIIIRRLADVAHPQFNTVKHNHQIEDSLRSDPNKTKKNGQSECVIDPLWTSCLAFSFGKCALWLARVSSLWRPFHRGWSNSQIVQ